MLIRKFETSVSEKIAGGQWARLNGLCSDRDALAATPVDDFMALLVT